MGSYQPSTATGTSETLSARPAPNWPSSLEPQHFTPPPFVSAQAKPSPTEIAFTPLGPGIVTGTFDSAAKICPSQRAFGSPQHCTVPEPVTAQKTEFYVDNRLPSVDGALGVGGVSGVVPWWLFPYFGNEFESSSVQGIAIQYQ
jgi:hypothetical protein